MRAANGTTDADASIGIGIGAGAYSLYNSATNSGGGGGGSVPASPTGVAAAAANAQVNLTWLASSGASGYYVKRSTTSGGPYTQVASLSALLYADNGVTNGTKYFYVVSALNTAGESANSAEANATPAAPPAMNRSERPSGPAVRSPPLGGR